jgi:type IX secretion system PorP/SprF family membrane protein
MRMKYIYSIVFFFSVNTLKAQQLPQISQYLRNQYMINPGAAGVYDFTDITLGGRLQWAGLADAPKTTYLAASAPISEFMSNGSRYNPGLRNSSGIAKNPEINTGKLKHALGLQAIGDQFGAFRKINISGTYAIHIPVMDNYNLSFGTNVGIVSHTFLQDKAVVTDASSDNTYSSFVSNNGNVNMLNVGAGLYFYSNELFLGVAADQLTQDLVTFGSGTANFDPRMHFNVTGGYKFHLGENKSLTPAFLVKYVLPVNPTIEGSLQFEYKEWIWAAVSYRYRDAIVGMVGVNLSNRFKIGYSFDYTLSDINYHASSGHELILGIMLGR